MNNYTHKLIISFAHVCGEDLVYFCEEREDGSIRLQNGRIFSNAYELMAWAGRNSWLEEL